MTTARFGVRRRHKLMQDSALAAAFWEVALGAQGGELLFQSAKRLEAGARAVELCIDGAIDCAAVSSRFGHEIEQQPDVGQRHIQRPAVPDEREPFKLALAVDSISVRQPARLRQQLDALVVANGLQIHAGSAGKIADFHARIVALDPVAATGFPIQAMDECCSAKACELEAWPQFRAGVQA